MINPYLAFEAKIKNIKDEAENIKLFSLCFNDKKIKFNPAPGQIVEAGISGFGEAPFAICSCGLCKNFEICVRKTGKLTNRMHRAKIGDIVIIRGPYGYGVFPETDRNLLLICGGLGLVPLRPLIQKSIVKFKDNKKRGQKIQLFYGARSQKDLIFKKEYQEWSKYIDINITLDKKEKGWRGHIGLVTSLFKDISLVENPIAILCGPPIMYKFALKELKKLNFKDEDIYMSLERRIHCGIGVCQHCAIGSKYICKDGPVFKYSDIKNIKNVI